MNRAIMDFATHSYHPIIFLILESGAVYSATLTALLILYRTGSWFQYVLLDAVRVFLDPELKHRPLTSWV